ncbi:MAG: PP2C family protein-serine/threonine phosphatase [Armatimonadota bacterium]
MTEERVGNADRLQPADDSDVFVALTRSAIIIALILMPSLGMLRQTPGLVQFAAIIGAVYTLSLFVSRLFHHWLPLQRPLAVAVDLLLCTAAIVGWPEHTQVLFQVYYVVVIVAAMWFGRQGAVITAAAAMSGFLAAQQHIGGGELTYLDLLGLLLYNGAPVLFILALVSSYVLRAREHERARALRLAHELQLARTMQRQMLPEELPEAEGYDLAVRLEAAREVSGDLYGFLPVHGDTLLVWVADVAGKSVHGMMHVSLLHSHLRAAAQEGLAPAAVADRVNRGVYDALQPSSFASAFIAQLQLRTGRLTYANCGHPPPLLLRGGTTDDLLRLHTNTPLVGITTTPNYLQLSVQMRPGDVLVITTDGVQEARRRSGEMFGEEGLIAVLSRMEGASAAELATGVIHAIREFSGGDIRDDAIVAVVRRLAQ